MPASKSARKRTNVPGTSKPPQTNVDSTANTTSRSRPGFYKNLCLTFLMQLVFIEVALLMFVRSPIEPVEFSLPSPPVWDGPLEPNTRLSRAKKLFEGKLVGPESIAVWKGKVYTGTADGLILEITDTDPPTSRVVTRFGKPPCGKFEDEPTCGRPLGMRFNKAGKLIVIDTYLGIFSVDVDTGASDLLFPPSVVNENETVFLNDFDFSEDGNMIYMSHSSIKWERRNFIYAFLESKQDGRLLQHDLTTNTTKVLINGIAFANGVQLSHDKKHILIVELGRCRILKYNLLSGEHTVFAENLPGIPDNIRLSSTGGYWIGLAGMRRANSFSFIDFMSSKPWLRTAIAKLFPASWVLKTVPQYSIIVELDQEGNIKQSLQDPSGHLSYISEVEDTGDVLYLGSFKSPYLAKVEL